MNADGSGLRKLTDVVRKHITTPAWFPHNISPAWSPDGSKIAFFSDRDGDEEIYIINADGSGLQQLTDNDWVDWAPAWSP